MTENAAPGRTPNEYVAPWHLEQSRWVALPHLHTGATASWQDVSVRPEAPLASKKRGFTVALCTNEVLEGDFEEGVGPHPSERLKAGEDLALDVRRMAVYLAGPFTRSEALACTELLLRETGVPVASLAEVGREEFYAGL